MNNSYFEEMLSQIYCTELQLKKKNYVDTEILLIYTKRQGFFLKLCQARLFNFEMIVYLFWVEMFLTHHLMVYMRRSVFALGEYALMLVTLSIEK